MTNLALVVDNPSIVNKRDERFISYFNEFINGQRSENTAQAYKSDLKQFFSTVFNKSFTEVTIKDMTSLTSLEAMKFHNSIKGKNATIKRKIESVKSFLDSLAVDHKEINTNIFNNINIKSVDLDRQGYGNLSWDEAFLFIEYAYIEQLEGNQMSMLLKLACVSSIRLNTLLNLDWEQHFRSKIEKGCLVNYIDVVDKQSRHKTPISLALYQELKDKLGDTGKLFPNLHPHKVGKLLKNILEYFEIDPNRNIKFHSFKKCGVNRVLEKTGDLTKAQVQGKHKSIITTQNNYVELMEDLSSKPSYTLDQNIDVVKELSDFTHQELLNAISLLSESAKFELLRLINK